MEELKELENNIPTIVVGVEDGRITSSGGGYQEFQNYLAAKKAFPDLDLMNNNKIFTAGHLERKNGTVINIRFETWEANKFYSS